MNAELVIDSLPAETDWPALKINPDLTASEANAEFQKAMRARSVLEPGEAREATFRTRFTEELLPHVVDGKVNLTPEVIEAKRQKITKQIEDEYMAAVRTGQASRVVAGILLTQEVRAEMTPPSWAGSLSFAASTADRMIARQLDIVEQQQVREWLKTATPSEALARYRVARDESDKSLIAVIESGADPGARPTTPEEVNALREFFVVRNARRLARVPLVLRDHVKAYKFALGPTTTERTLKLVAKAVA